MAFTVQANDLDVHPASSASSAKTHIIEAAHGYAWEVKRGEQFRVVDLYGEQIIDFAAWKADTNLIQKLSMSYSRYHLSGVQPAVGEYLWTNADEPIFRIIEDTVKVHDMTFMSCNPEFYHAKGASKHHRSCAANIAEVMRPHGMNSHLEVTDPFNIFQNTPNYSLKALGSSKPGDYIQFEALMDCVCAASCCPYDYDGVNGGKITDVAVITGL